MNWKTVNLLSYHMHFYHWLRDQHDYLKTTKSSRMTVPCKDFLVIIGPKVQLGISKLPPTDSYNKEM